MNEQKSFLMYFAEMIEQYYTDRQSIKIQCTSSSQPNRPRHFIHWLMPNGGTLLLVLLLIVTAQVWAQPLINTTNTPGPSATTVNYQGRLADNAGSPLDGNYGMSFALYDTASDGNLVWGPEVHDAVPVSDGLFSVGLGSRTTGGIPTTTWNGDRYLEITVGGETLSPRELIRSVPIAGMALTVPDGAIGSSQIADGAVGTNKIVDGAVGSSQIADGAIGADKIADNAIDGTNLAPAGFGSSNAPLSNLIVREPVTAADFTVTAEGTGVWDLRPIVGNTAQMVMLLVRIKDDADNSLVSVWPNGETRRFGVNTGIVRQYHKDYQTSSVLWIRCDAQQRIQYQIDAKSADNKMDVLNITVIGWAEPAAIP